jgi:hypothetical protein
MQGTLEAYERVRRQLRPMATNGGGRFEIEESGIELGLLEGKFEGMMLPWLRVWDKDGDLLLLADDRADAADAGLEETRELLTEQIDESRRQRERADGLSAELAALRAKVLAAGIDPAPEFACPGGGGRVKLGLVPDSYNALFPKEAESCSV